VASLRTSADGQTPHRGAAIGLVFERLIEEGRKALFPSSRIKPSPTFDSVTVAATSTPTTMTKSPPNTASSAGGAGGSETTRLSSVDESGRPRKIGKKKPKSLERPHPPVCGCKICKRTVNKS